ncbi:MAG: chloride channel protein [Trebonia sp.]
MGDDDARHLNGASRRVDFHFGVRRDVGEVVLVLQVGDAATRTRTRGSAWAAAANSSIYGVAALSARLPVSRKLRPAMGAALVGLLALWLPEMLVTGYGWVQEGLSGQLLHTPLYIVLLLPFARIAATALSIGTGGSGGVFGPGMVTGAFTGLAIWRLLEPVAPGVGHDPAPFVVVGMMAVFGGIYRAPLAVMLMVAEMTGSISVLAPAIVAIAVSWFIVERADDSTYRSQLPARPTPRPAAWRQACRACPR